MGELIRKSHNVSLIMYHFVFVAKYRRLVINAEVDILLKEICVEISKRYEVRFLESRSRRGSSSSFDPIGSKVQSDKNSEYGEKHNSERDFFERPDS